MSDVKLPSRYISWLTLNRGCQLRCDWCYAKDSGFNSKMSDETFAKSILLLRDVNAKEVCLIGGEPTIDPRFVGMVRQLSEEGFFVSVVTNGIKFADKVFLSHAVDAGLKNIVLSLKSTDRAGYIRNTHRDVFDDVMLAIQNLSQLDTSKPPHHNLLVTLCGDFMQDVDKLIKTIVTSGIKRVTFDTERPIVNGGSIEYGGVSPQVMANFLAENYEKVDKLTDFGVEYTVYVTHPHCLFPGDYIQKLEKSGRLASGCQIQRGNGIIIDERGELLPCNHFCKSSFGSLSDCQTATDYVAWRNTESVIRFYKKVSDYPTETCSRCSMWEKCGAGCRINWLKFGEKEMIRNT